MLPRLMLMKLSLNSRRKIAFINGNIRKSTSTHGSEYEIWKKVNDLVFSWILNVVSPQIASTIIHTDTLYEAWSNLEKRYRQKNAPKTYQIKYELNNLQQGT